MRVISFLLASCLLAADRPGWIASASGSLGGGVFAHFTTVAEPPLAKSLADIKIVGVAARNGRIHRFVVDATAGKYFGYDLVLLGIEAPNRFRIAFEPLPPWDQISRQTGPYSPVPLPKYPAPQVVTEGDVIALDLLVRPDGTQKIVDYIEVTFTGELKGSKTASEARDFTLDDGPVDYQFKLPNRLFINGQPYSGVLGMTGKPGSTLWFSIPGRGRYVLSLTPVQGFEKAGMIRDNVITFNHGGDSYELRTGGLIIRSGGAWNLYVRLDPHYQSGNEVRFGTDKLINLPVR